MGITHGEADIDVTPKAWRSAVRHFTSQFPVIEKTPLDFQGVEDEATAMEEGLIEAEG